MGTLTTTITDSNRGGERGKYHYSPPWENGFDECFSTEAKTPTYDPMIKPVGWNDHRWWNPVKKDQPGRKFNTHYWTGQDQMVTENLKGDDSKLIMDHAISFIGNRYKIISIDKGETFMMFDIKNDPGEQNDIAGKKPDLLLEMKKELESWQESCKQSLAGYGIY